MVDFRPDILDTEVPEVEPLDVDVSSEPQHELAMALSSDAAKTNSPVVFDFSLQSRVEVILNAIINDLVYGKHPKSRVEQILLYILGEANELPKPHSRVEELLIDLALELESTDVSPKSRVEQILLVLLNQPYEFPIIHSRVEELLVQLQKHISEVTGPLPLVINTDGTALLEYRIYGNTVDGESVGVQTENLFTPSTDKGYYQNNQFIADDDYLCTPYIPLDDPEYWVKMDFDTTNAPIGGKYGVEWFDDYNVPVYGECIDIRFHAGWIYDGKYEVDPEVVVVHTPRYVRAFIHKDCTKVNLSIGSDRQHNPYIPYGYKLPMVSRGENSLIATPIYIGDTKLAKDEYVSYSEQKVYKYNGELTLKGDETNIDYYGIFEGVETFYIDIPNNSEVVSGLQPYLSCNYYTKTSTIRPPVDKTCRYQSSSNDVWNIGRVYFMDNDYTSLSSFKTHLSELYDAGEPLKVWYTLKNAPIAIDPPVPLPALPTTEGSTTFEYGGGEPQPEQMYVKYNES
jgi:hypothetical protein